MARRVGALAVSAAMVIGMASLALASGALDGKTFTGTMGKKGETQGKADDFVFQDGAFESTLCTTFGYGTGAYTAEPAGDAVEFTAETTNQDGGTMQWQGLVKGDAIEGTAVSMENGHVSESWFRGTLKAQ